LRVNKLRVLLAWGSRALFSAASLFRDSGSGEQPKGCTPTFPVPTHLKGLATETVATT
jgi:hypothetical protein